MCSYYDPPDVWRETWRRARQPRPCDECRATIAAGERYEVTAGLSEGRWYGASTCARCVAARHWLMAVCDGYLVGGVLEELGDHLGELVSSPALERLVALMRNRWVGDEGLLDAADVAVIADRAILATGRLPRRQYAA